jgi:hypothetical protein
MRNKIRMYTREILYVHIGYYLPLREFGCNFSVKDATNFFHDTE